MREYIKKNRIQLSEYRRKRRLKRLDIELEQGRIRNRRYHEKNRDEVNKRAKEKNWYYNKEKAKIVRKTFYKKNWEKISLASAKTRAKSKNLAYSIDIDWFKENFVKGCAVTKLPLDPNGSKTPWTVHIDRIIPSKGYTKENARLVCACFNLAKKHWTDEDVHKMAKHLIENYA